MNVSRPIVQGEIWTNTLTQMRVTILHVILDADPRYPTEVEYFYTDHDDKNLYVKTEARFRQWHR